MTSNRAFFFGFSRSYYYDWRSFYGEECPSR